LNRRNPRVCRAARSIPQAGPVHRIEFFFLGLNWENPNFSPWMNNWQYATNRYGCMHMDEGPKYVGTVISYLR
jgi:hypothetical protein